MPVHEIALIFQLRQFVADGRRGDVKIVTLDQALGTDRLNAARAIFAFRFTGDVLAND